MGRGEISSELIRGSREVKRVCVYCGSGKGDCSGYVDVARLLGKTLADEGIGVVYGGGKKGMMGALAESVLESGGQIIGVIPKDLFDRGLGLTEVTELRVVDSMHERKALMADLADAFVAMPGGLGTVEEFFEILTWSQLGLHRKACGLLNAAGYFDYLIRLVDHMVDQGFAEPSDRSRFVIDDSPERLLVKLRSLRVPGPCVFDRLLE